MKYLFIVILLAILNAVNVEAVVGSPLTIETIREAENVQLTLFDKKSGLPALQLRYAGIHRSRPRVGLLQLSFYTMRVEKLRVLLELDRPSCNQLNLQLSQLMASGPIQFIYAGPVEIIGKRKNMEEIRIEAGRAKIHRDGGFYLYKGVSWKTPKTSGKLTNARLQANEKGNAWLLTTKKLEGVTELRFGSQE